MDNVMKINNETNVEELLASLTNENNQTLLIEPGTDMETIQKIMMFVSNLPEQGFRFHNINFKHLDSEEKVEVLKFAIKNELCIISIIETLVLLVNSCNNYNAEFFESEDVFFSSLVDYLDICDEIEEETTLLREKIAYYFLATLKSYVNHPRFVLSEANNYEQMPGLYEYMLMLLDVFNLSFILNTPKLNVPEFASIPNNINNNSNLIDLWSDKQKFVRSTLADLSDLVQKEIELNKTEQE